MTFRAIFQQLESGHLRAANKHDGVWSANLEVKSAILDAFRYGVLKDYADEHYVGFVDKDTMRPKKFSISDNIRLVPGGSSVRAGSFVAPGVVIMPPSFINVGAYIDAGTMVDSHVLVGSCAQIGKNVHLSAGVQIGGVLEPIGLAPVVIEDNCFIGAGVIIVEGIQVGAGAVIAPGVKLSRAIPVYDCINETILAPQQPIPENAVVVPGGRAINDKLPWAKSQGLSLDCAIIIKYKDDKTKAAIELEQFLR